MSLTDIDPLLGRTLAEKFEIRELLGVGAMGKVYRAHHTGLDKAVAIKVLIRVPAVQDAQARRFRREARTASRLEHPNTVRILDFGEEPDGLLYIAMEYLEGVDLQARLSHQGPMQAREIAWIMSQVFSALAAAHASDVIHRDIKPGNIMLVRHQSEDGPVEDFVKVCDFGLAKIIDTPGASLTGAPLTAQGAVFGTPSYMSPEQARGEPLDPRSDIYSCGVVMYKMMVGHPPFRAETPAGVLLGHIHETPPPLKSWGLPVHPELVRVVQRAMAKAPADRFSSAIEARDALRRVLDDEGWSKPPPTAAAVAPIPPLRRPTDVPTEQVRLRRDQHPTDLDPDPEGVARTLLQAPSLALSERVDATLLDRASRADEPTRYTDTMPPASGPAPTPRPRTPWWAIVPGALALLGAGALVVVLAMKREASSEPPAPAVERAPAASSEAAPAAPETSRTASRARARPAPLMPVAPPPAARPRAPAAAETAAPTAPTVPRSVETGAAKARAPANLPRASAATVRGPRVPRADPRPSNVVATLAEVQLSGALSRQRCQDALTKQLEAARACLEPLAAEVRMQSAGRLRVKARIDERGKLQDLESSGTDATTGCLRKAFASARLPPADTGLVRIRFVLRYRTVVQ